KLDRDPGPGSIDPDLPAVPRREAPQQTVAVGRKARGGRPWLVRGRCGPRLRAGATLATPAEGGESHRRPGAGGPIERPRFPGDRPPAHPRGRGTRGAPAPVQRRRAPAAKWFAYAASVSVGLLILAIPATSLSPVLSNVM